MQTQESKILSGHQPDFLPWLGVFYKAKKSLLFKITDYVQYTKSWTNRVKIKSTEGIAIWLTVPVNSEDKTKPIRDVRIGITKPWKDSCLGKIRHCYFHAPFYHDLKQIETCIKIYNGDNLMELNMQLLKIILNRMNINCELVIGSHLDLAKGKTDHIVDSCNKLQCRTYLAGQGADYLEQDMFDKSGITLIRSDFNHPEYDQINGPFIAGLSVIDAIANIGWERTSLLLE
jgi:hypothetical protein